VSNKRGFFRLSIYNEELILTNNGVEYQGKLKDISGNGLSFYLEEEIYFDTAFVKFSLSNVEYSVQCRFIRREEISVNEFSYACQFMTLNQKKQSKLMSTLIRMDALRRRK
jgi:hypothetical protein